MKDILGQELAVGDTIVVTASGRSAGLGFGVIDSVTESNCKYHSVLTYNNNKLSHDTTMKKSGRYLVKATIPALKIANRPTTDDDGKI